MVVTFMKKLDRKVAKRSAMNMVLISIHGSEEWAEEHAGKKITTMIAEAVKVIVAEEALTALAEERLHRATEAVAEGRKEEVHQAVVAEAVLHREVLAKEDLDLCLVKKSG